MVAFGALGVFGELVVGRAAFGAPAGAAPSVSITAGCLVVLVFRIDFMSAHSPFVVVIASGRSGRTAGVPPAPTELSAAVGYACAPSPIAWLISVDARPGEAFWKKSVRAASTCSITC